MDKKLLVVVGGVLGVLLVVAAVVYFITPANSLPTFFPGYDPTLTRHHFTHGVGTLILGLGCFVLAWFASGKKGSS